MDASHLLIILSEQEALRLGLNSISVDIPTTLSKITLAKIFLEGCKYTGFSYSKAENITIRTLFRLRRHLCITVSCSYFQYLPW